jgi:hypothetical protein
MIDRYSDIKNAIDLGTITDKKELRKMREELAQIQSIPDGLKTSLVGFGSLTEDFNEYIAKAGKKGGLDLTTANPTTLNHINVFLNNAKGERKFLTKFDENGNMQTGIFIKSEEEGDKGKFYTKDELTSYMSGKTGGLPTIYDDTKDQEEMKSLIVGKDPETNRAFIRKEYLSEKEVKRKGGSTQVINTIDEEKVKNSLRPLALATIEKQITNSNILSFYNNYLKGKDGKIYTLKQLQDNLNKEVVDENGKKLPTLKQEMVELYLNKTMKDNNLIDFSKKSYTYKPKVSKDKPKQIDTSYIDELDISLEGIGQGSVVDLVKVENTIKPFGFRVKNVIDNTTTGAREFTVTKSIKGKERPVTISSNMTPQEVKNLLKYVAGGKEPTGSRYDPYVYVSQ